MAIPTFPAGHLPTADEYTFLLPIIAYKTANQSVNNTTTLTNDTALVVSVVASCTYLINTLFISQGPGNAGSGNLKIGWTFPTAATLYYGAAGQDQSAFSGGTGKQQGIGEWGAVTNVSSPASVASYAAGLNTLTIQGGGLLIVGANSGTLQLQFAQETAVASNTSMMAGSWVELRRAN